MHKLLLDAEKGVRLGMGGWKYFLFGQICFRDQTNTLFLLYKYYEAAIPFFAEVAEKRNSWRESRGARNKKADKRISHVAMQRIYINICLGNETIFVENEIFSHKKETNLKVICSKC